MQEKELKLTPFTTEGFGARRPGPRYDVRRSAEIRGRARRRRGGSMSVKIGICLGIFVLALAVQRIFHPFGNAAVQASSAGTSTDAGTDEALGRLRFVRGGAVSSVFSGSQRWTQPVSQALSVKTGEDLRMEIAAAADDVISSPASGEVREIGTDTELGQFLRIAHGSGLESIYYNLATVSVELGQPVQALDTLGTVGESGTLYISVLQSGEAQPPENYILVRAES